MKGVLLTAAMESAQCHRQVHKLKWQHFRFVFASPLETDAWRSLCDVGFVPILLQKSAIMTAKRLTRFFEVLVAVSTPGDRVPTVPDVLIGR